MKKVFAIILALALTFNLQVFASSGSSAPKVVSSIPTKNSSSFSISGDISIKFSENIKAGSKFSSITLKYSGKSVKISRKIVNNLLKIDPTSNLKNKTNYKLTIPVGAVVDRSGHKVTSTYVLSFTTSPKATPTKKPTPKPTKNPTPTKLPTPTAGPTGTPTGTPVPLALVYHETFDTPFNAPAAWTEDTYGKNSPYYVDVFSDDGDYFIQKRGSQFLTDLSQFRAFRKSFTYGQDGWLTVEEYGRDSNKDGKPETGGKFVNAAGKAKLISLSHTDGAIIRSTNKMPARYRIEVTVSNINFGGTKNGSWTYDGKFNGYDGNEYSGPWDYSMGYEYPVKYENGVYFLCITDYPNPAPHNNTLIHHHRKLVMDTDNNTWTDGSSWSYVWNPITKTAVMDGSHYINMLSLNGTDFGDDWTGNNFYSWTPGGWKSGATFADKYLDNESYVFTVERDVDSYTMSVSGKFYYGGNTTYTAKKKFTSYPVTWHYNQNPGELTPPYYNQTKTYNGNSFSTWPTDSSYPDFFFFGDPHINAYEGTCEYDDVKLYIPNS